MARRVPHQADYGIVRYNNFKFPPALNASAKAEPIYDESGRGLMYVRYQIKIEFIICLDDVGELGEISSESATYKPYVRSDGSSSSSNYNGPVSGHPNMTKGTIDPQIAHIRRKLMQPGRHLLVQDVGLGYDLNVNDPDANPQSVDTGLFDVAWGPKPINLSWESIASNRAARVVWEVEVAIPECEDPLAGSKENRPQVWNIPQTAGALPVEVTQVVYNQSWDIDMYGKTVKRYQAILQIRGTINPSNLVDVFTSADGYRKYFEPDLKEGYIRTRSYSLSNDKSKLTINITDAEHGTDFPLPPGASEMDVDYSISSGVKGSSTFAPAGGGWTGWQIWQAKLSGKMVLAKGFDPIFRRLYPYFVFLLIMRSRFTLISEGTSTGGTNLIESFDQFGGGTIPANVTAGTGVMSLPVSFSLGESIFGQEFSFNFQWEIIGCPPRAAPFFLRYGCDPTVLMEDQYKQNPNHSWSWSLWKKSMYHNEDNNSWWVNIVTQVPRPPDAAGNAQPGTIPLKILGDWKVKRAPFSMSGADNLRFEGDNRMEPCQPVQDFWYSGVKSSFSGSPPPSYAEVISVPQDKDNTVITCTSEMEIIENNQVISAAPLDNPNYPSKIGEYQEGNSTGLGTANKALRQPQGPGTGRKTPNSTHGGTNSISDPVASEIKAGSPKDVKLQSLGPTSYRVRATGEALTTGLPFNAPRTMRWGEGYAVVQSKRVQTSRVCRGEVELWNTRWDITYLISGSPNGFELPNPKGLVHKHSQIATKSSEAFRWA
tara:strand:- start:2372 stop:4675 length:2304 start_codon:yes stop_codon:yes gene_type:complete